MHILHEEEEQKRQQNWLHWRRDNIYLVYVPKTRKLVAVWDVIIKESKVGLIPDNTETPDLLDGRSERLRIWQPDDCPQNAGNKEKQGTSTAKRGVAWRGEREHISTDPETRCIGCWGSSTTWVTTSPRGSLRDSESLEDNGTEVFS